MNNFKGSYAIKLITRQGTRLDSIKKYLCLPVLCKGAFGKLDRPTRRHGTSLKLASLSYKLFLDSYTSLCAINKTPYATHFLPVARNL